MSIFVRVCECRIFALHECVYNNKATKKHTGWTPVNAIKRLAVLVFDSIRTLLRFDNSPLVGAFYSVVAVCTGVGIAAALGWVQGAPQPAALQGPIGMYGAVTDIVLITRMYTDIVLITRMLK